MCINLREEFDHSSVLQCSSSSSGDCPVGGGAGVGQVEPGELGCREAVQKGD